ncbi:Metallo-dependent phosphatase-like protein [Gongronella butleri]|nr:Metallo-dependent phosphatase-like protein [Gongronella butleri]
MNPKDKRKWSLIAIAAAIVAVIVIVVPVSVVMAQKNNQNSSNNGGPSYAMAQSPYDNLTRVVQLNQLADKKRIFVIGDVHGCSKELAQMLDTINYTQTTDAVILAGDLTNKGPDSPGVLDLAQQKNLYCVRGNHDDRVVRLKNYQIQTGSLPDNKNTLPEGNVADPLKFNSDHADIARNLTIQQYNYLAACPMAIDMPFLNARVVHGGLDPNLDPINTNDPYTVFNIRNEVDGVPTADNNDGGHWTDWYMGTLQAKNAQPLFKVYYGHDASRGLDLETVTFGLDSGCVYGDKLSALEIRTHNLTQISCPKYSN